LPSQALRMPLNMAAIATIVNSKSNESDGKTIASDGIG
jgi:hypothetical protein